jgi:hypothetical protein
VQERHHKNIVCYTEDKSGWPDMITGIFNAYDFDVNHFETNSEAWDNPDIGIENNPSLYDVYVLDQDTECSLDGSELIEMILALPFDPNRKILIIILSSSSRDLFTRDDIQVLKQKHNVQLCWKSNTYALQAAYARDKLDHIWDRIVLEALDYF